MSKQVKYWTNIALCVLLIVFCLYGTATFVHNTGDVGSGLSLFVMSCVCSAILASSLFSRGRGY